MKISPLVLGSGNSGLAMKKAFAVVGLLHPEWEIAPAVTLKRGESLSAYAKEGAVLCLANPHGLHARTLVEAEKVGFHNVVAEKPICVNAEEIRLLEKLKLSVAVCHGYRVMWGPETVKAWIDSGKLGKIVSMEGHYWQSSAAQKALSGEGPGKGWKNETNLGGSYDVYLDLAAHWVDLVHFLSSGVAVSGRAELFYANAETAHRDTHVHLDLLLPQGIRSRASISKTFHGAGNEFVLHVLGTRGRATWRFQDPDHLEWAEGSRIETLSRQSKELGTQQSPFHATGWLEGYVEVISQLVGKIHGVKPRNLPDLKSSLEVMTTLLERVETTKVS